MTAKQILAEIEKLPSAERHQLAVELGKGLGDLRGLFLAHPDQEMVTKSCLHFLGDAAQEWWESREN